MNILNFNKERHGDCTNIFFYINYSRVYFLKTLICELGVFTRVCTPLYMYDMYVRWCTHVYVVVLQYGR